ncbi:MAG: 5-(carboxyamino)imidazole ribonucleotide synthase [Vulcanimicrobiota bacterium]
MKVGILGAGQLGRMLASSAVQLGLQPVLYDPDPAACGHQAGQARAYAYADQERLEGFAREVELCTFEFENVPVEAVQTVSRYTLVSPGMAALAVSQDRLHEKNFFRTLGIDTPEFAPWNGQQASGLVKTRRFGYDGKGQWDLARGRPDSDAPCIWEEKLAFQRELAQIGVRSRSGQVAFYPLVETVQKEGILCQAIAPARDVSPALHQQARDWVGRILEALDYVGVMALELFELEGRLLANEMAPRVHNSGHWTDRGCRTSQFENHWRALLDWPLGATEATGFVRLINLLGSLPEKAPAGSTYYGKEPRPGRKLGHITLVAESAEAVDQQASGVFSHAT